MRSQGLGFDKEHVIFLGANRDVRQHYEVFKQELLQNANILSVSAASHVPGRGIVRQGYLWEGSRDKSKGFNTIAVDPDYLDVLGLKLAAGRDFSWDIASDWTDAYILNEPAVKRLGWDDAIGMEFRVWGRAVVLLIASQ